MSDRRARAIRRPLAAIAVLPALVAACGSTETASPTATSPSPVRSVASEQVAEPPAPPARATPNEPRAPDVSPSVSPPAEAPEPLGSVYVPPAGRYEYEASGFSQTGDGPREPLSGPQVDEVTSRRVDAGVELKVVTKFGEKSQDEVTYEVGTSEARITRIVSTSGSGLGAVRHTIIPDPAIPVAKLPYRVGARWQFQWKDTAAGVQATGRGEVVSTEDVRTWKGIVTAVVLQLDQELTGTATGRRRSTLWINPSTGVRLKRRVVSDSSGAFGNAHSELVSTLVKGPST